MLFIQLGKHYLAIAHIVAVVIDDCDGEHLAVYMAHRPSPLYFLLGTPEADALIEWLQPRKLRLVGDKNQATK